ncbi:ion transporter [Saccharophagus degradans]|uniref:Ion transporter n=1 Tax=Saccharophagus degradans TaxID=86304 RepID=A0AAW7X1S9_9GAMM|nr:ion transporter [Saccharophagus degradans]MBU2985580.1 ion transporter [Saccharophagus degradans]MDO6421280.1 ion transporter [Saccharophagus degradans]MDO6605809.1 ion transporter [Saccharophagus degradans]WGO96588.1 ion transporter [Saccharophagus degradans]
MSSPTKFSVIESRFAKLRSNKLFESFVIFVIVFSALVIGAKTYDIPDSVSNAVAVLDWFITGFFLVEICIRFLGEEQKTRFFRSGWNIFDTIIVMVSVIPIDDSELAIVGRLIRIFRVLRMVSIIPELRMLLNSLLKAMPQLGYVVLLMFIIFYIYAAVGSTFFATINEDLWGDITLSLLTLFRVMTFEDWTDVMYETMKVYPFSWAYYITFIFFTAFAFLNMIIGIVVNVMEQEHRSMVEEGLENEGQELAAIKAELAEIKGMLNTLVNQPSK